MEKEMIIQARTSRIFEAEFGSPLTGLEISYIRIRLDEMREWSEEYGKPPEQQWEYIWNTIMPRLMPGAKMVFIKPPEMWSKDASGDEAFVIKEGHNPPPRNPPDPPDPPPPPPPRIGPHVA